MSPSRYPAYSPRRQPIKPPQLNVSNLSSSLYRKKSLDSSPINLPPSGKALYPGSGLPPIKGKCRVSRAIYRCLIIYLSLSKDRLLNF